MSRILLTGANGLLGSAIQSVLHDREVVVAERRVLDVTRPADLLAFIGDTAPQLVINCAADTDVEGAEADSGKAFAANAILPDLLAQGCRRIHARFVHFSSTGCYGAHADTPYDDFASLVPTTLHHRSKVAGEAAVRESLGGDALILRLGWLYGGSIAQRRNFVWARICEARGKDEIISDPSQVGSPTFVGDVAAQVLRLIEVGVGGTFNCVASGAATRLEYVACILKAAGSETRLVPGRFARRAAVSPNEAALNAKLNLMGLNIMPAWDKAVGRYVQDLLASERTS